MSLLFNMLSRLEIAFIPRSKCLLIPWLQSPSVLILEPKKIKSLTVFIGFPSICHEVMGQDVMILVLWMLSFKPAFSLFSFTLIKRLFSSSWLSVIRVVSSAYLRLLIFLLASLIPVCASSSLAFLMMYSAYKLNKQGVNTQPCHTPFLIWNQSIVPRPVLNVASWLAYSFLRRQVRWSGIPISWRIFNNLWSTQSLCILNMPKKYTLCFAFLECSCFFYDPTDVDNLISGSSAFPKSSLNIWNFSVHILLQPNLENFEYYFANLWDEYNCVVVWTFFGIVFLLNWNEIWPLPENSSRKWEIPVGIFHAKMGTIKDRNDMDLAEA